MISKIKNWVFIDVLYILIALSFSVYNFQNREYDWDLPGYLGCLFESENPGNLEKIKNETYISIRKEASPKQFDNLVEASEHRKILYKKADAFYEQLPYFQVKIGYNLLVRAFYFVGFSAPYSVLFLNSVLFFISIIFFYFSLKAIYSGYPFFVFFVSILFSSLPVLHYLSRIASPDILLVLLLLVFANFVINNKKPIYVFFIIFLIVFSRPDYVIFGLSFYFSKMIYEFVLEKKLKRDNFIYIILIGLVYFLIIKYYNYPGWKHVFYDSFIYRRAYISGQSPEFSFKTYVNIVLKGIVNMKKITLISLFFVIWILFFGKNLWIKVVALLLFFNIYLKFLFFPAAGEYRFYLPFILSLFLLFIFELKNNNFIRNKILKLN